MNPREKLVLTYDNRKAPDGVGAQLQRIYGIYSISRLLDVPYLHTPLSRVDYQGLSALEENVGDSDFHLEFNNLFEIKSDVMPSDDFYKIKLVHISMDTVHQLAGLADGGESGGRPVLVQLAMPYGITDHFPDCYEVCKAISPFVSSVRDGRALRVAIHVRRGELLVLDSDRLLSNVFYINVAQNIARVLEALKIEYQIELHTEVPRKEFIVQRDHHGISNRISAPAVINPEMCRIEEFNALPNLVHCINEKAIDCLGKLATADILVMSRSSFSYVGGILNRKGIIFYHPFWHPPLSSWMTIGPDGQIDQSKLMVVLKSR